MNIELSDEQIDKIVIEDLKTLVRDNDRLGTDFYKHEIEAIKVVLGLYLSESDMIKFVESL